MNMEEGNDNHKSDRRTTPHRLRGSKKKHETTFKESLGSNVKGSNQAMEPPLLSEPRKQRSSGKFHFQNRLSLETSASRFSSEPHHLTHIEDENTILSNTSSVRPGAFREGADIEDIETYTMNLDERTEIAPEPLMAQEAPLEAEVVEEHDLQKEVQQKMNERTVDATSVKIAGSGARSTPPDDTRSKSALLFLVVVGLLFLGVAITLAITLSSKSDSHNITFKPVLVLTDGPTSPPTFISDFEFAKDLFTPLSGVEALSDASSPQYKALSWIVYEDPAKLSMTNETESTLIERYVIALLYFATGGPNWLVQLNFLGSSSICDWGIEVDTIPTNGINCNDEGSTVGIRLDENDLNGTLPLELSALSSLEVLSIFRNSLHGPLPPSLGVLGRLQRIELAGNQHLTGPIPELFTDLRKLEWLSLDQNELTGTIPKSLNEILSLEYLSLESNFLTGTIPEVSALGDLLEIWLGRNLLTGSIPESMYSLPLEVISIWGNSISGPLSDKLGNLEDLIALQTETNNMSGSIPSNIGMLRNLENLYLSGNSFSGPIPSEIGLLTRLNEIQLHNNHLSGTVPVELSTLSPEVITLSANNLTGSLDMFCSRTPLFFFIEADCGGVDPPVKCPCCTTCCDSSFGDCMANLPAICTAEKSLYDHPDGQYYYETAGTVCDCATTDFDSPLTLSCADTKCQTCNGDGTVCSENNHYSFQYGPDGLWKKVQLTFQYVVGRNDMVGLEIESLENYDLQYKVTVNGQVCNSCYHSHCADGFFGLHVNCENVEGAGYVDLCDGKRNDDDGPLAVFALQDPAFLSGCPPRIYSLFT